MIDDIKFKLATNRQFFFEALFPHYIKTPLKPIADIHNEWFNLLSTEKNLIIVAPRGHAKSTVITVVDNLFDICNQNEKYIMIISDTPEQAKEHLSNIVEELESNERLINFYGRLYEGRKTIRGQKEKWTENEIITKTGIKIVAKGWRLKTRGARFKEDRPTKIVLDDVESDETVNSETMRNKLKDIFERKILNLGSFDTKIRIVGTILHFDSLLQHEVDNPRPGWTIKFYKSIQENKPIWPEWWTMDRLIEKKTEIGSLAFEQEFQNNPIDPQVQIIKPKSYYEGNLDFNTLDCYAYIDLAISEKETADYTAIVTIGRHRETGKLYVIDPVRIRGSVEDQLNLVYEQNSKYRYLEFGVESVAYQKAFAQILQNRSNQSGIYIPVIEIQVDKDKVRRTQEIVPYIENGTILFNKNHQDFILELVQFPKSAHNDYVDSFVGAVKLAIGEVSSGKIYTGAKDIYSRNI